MNSALRNPMESPLIPVRLFFDQTKDDRFFVLAEVMFRNCYGCVGQLSVLTFDHEDQFLERVGSADLPLADITLLAATIIRTISIEAKNLGWLELNFTEVQIQALGLAYASDLHFDSDGIHEVI